MIQTTPTNIQEYPCPIHKKERITHICTDFNCVGNPLVCHACLHDSQLRAQHSAHEEFLMPILEAIPDLANIVETSKTDMAKLYVGTAGRKQSQSLFKKLSQSQRHVQLLQSHIRGIKVQIDRDLETLQTQFLRRLQQHKQNLHHQLDHYQRTYSQNFQSFKQMIEPVMTYHLKSKYYSNPNSISLKLLAQIRRKSIDWYLQLKKILTFASKIAQRPQAVFDTYSRATQYLTAMVGQEIPNIRSVEMNEVKLAKVHHMLADYFSDYLSIKDTKPLATVVADVENYIQNMPQAQVQLPQQMTQQLTQRTQMPTQPTHPISSIPSSQTTSVSSLNSQKQLQALQNVQVPTNRLPLKPTIRY